MNLCKSDTPVRRLDDQKTKINCGGQERPPHMVYNRHFALVMSARTSA